MPSGNYHRSWGLLRESTTEVNPEMTELQVSRSTKTLVQAINDGEVPKPALMRWNTWQPWRRSAGARPTAAADGAATNSTQESALWKSTMLEYYGANWALDLASLDETAQPAPGPSNVALPSGPRQEPATDANVAVQVAQPPPEVPAPFTPRRNTEVSPGSGLQTGAASPGSGQVSPSASWSSRNPGTPGKLTREIIKSFQPQKETLEKYFDRIDRQAKALELLGEPLTAEMVPTLREKARFELRLHMEAKDDPERQTRLAKREYALEILEAQTEESQYKIWALEGLLGDRGIDAEQLKQKVLEGTFSAPTPVRPIFQRSSVPSPVPAADAGAQHFAMDGNDTPIGVMSPRSREVEDLRGKLVMKDLELAAQKISSAHTPADNSEQMVQLLQTQTELMTKVLEKPKPVPRSTIRVEPKVFWPKLGDDGPGGQEVDNFYDKFEEICGLCNNGEGMPDREMMITLKSCLHGSRRKIYENMAKADRVLMLTDEGPGEVYQKIKKRLYRFLETATEKQLRVRQEWQNLTKGRNHNAIQFEAEWEQIHTDLKEVGLEVNETEKFLAYIVKVGPPTSETIRLDRRPRSDGAGGMTTRLPQTWEECHDVLCEIEGVKAGSRAFIAARAAGQTAAGLKEYYEGNALNGAPAGASYWDAGGFGDGKGKGKKGQGDRKGKGKGQGKDDGEKQVCYNMRDKGTCEFGANCRFSHDPKLTGRTPSGALTKAAKKAGIQKPAPAAKVKAQNEQQGGQEKPKGRGKNNPDKKPAANKKKILCKYLKIKGLGNCPDGKNCPYSHSAKSFDKGGKFIGKGKGKGKEGRRGGPQEEVPDDCWDVPVGLHDGGPMCLVRQSQAAGNRSVPRAGQSRADDEPGETNPLLVPTKHTQYAELPPYDIAKQRLTIGDKTPYPPKGPPKELGVIHSLSELPARCWTEAQKDESGIQFFTGIKVGMSEHQLMLDGGSAVNSTTEELVLQILNENQKAGISLSDKRHPIKKFEKWKDREALRGVAGGANVPLLGAVVMEIRIIEVGKTDGPKVNVRFKICKAKSTDWVGWIVGARAIDCGANGGLGFIPLEHCHSFTTLGIFSERTERPGGRKPEQSCYPIHSCNPIRLSSIDSDSDSDYDAAAIWGVGASRQARKDEKHVPGVPLLYEGDPITLSKGDGAWVPVVAVGNCKVDDRSMQVALPTTDSPVEAVPGIWDTGQDQGVLCIIGTDEFDTVLEPGTKIGEIHTAALQTRICQGCGGQDTDAWVVEPGMKTCNDCGSVLGGGVSACRQCGETQEACCLLSYAGCGSCRPEQKLKGKVRKGPATNMLAKSALAFAALCSVVDPAEAALNVKLHPVFHIIEEPGGIRYLTECEVPTETYNSARTADLAARYPKASQGVIEHLEALEPFLDTSILAGFSYGISKAFIMVTKGSLLGHQVDRNGSSHEGERTQAIQEFAPLKDITQVRQFVGSTNWVRRYLLPCYATAVKILGEYMKPAAVFPEGGLGSGNSEGCKAVKVIKLLCVHAIQISTIDEASAIDGSRPLEQVADACGIAWGSTNVQMTADLSGFKVLLMTGKGFTPAQQAWAAITLETFAQLGGKRAQRKILGPMRSLNWTDHANLTKQQQIELVDIDLKHLRWVSEIIADGSEIRSLAGRSCRLGDGTSRNPVDREALMEQRTKDLEGMIGQVRGFDLDEFLSDWELEGSAVPWGVGDGSWVKEKNVQPKRVPSKTPAASAALTDSALAEVMSAEGVSPVLKILYVPDYVTREQRIAATSQLFVQMSQLLPGYTIQLALAEGPFEDDDSVATHFEGDALGKRGPTKQIPALKVDLHTSVVKLARHAALHKPKLIIGKGQGGVVAAVYGHPGCLEQVLATRNVQPAELPEIGQAWGNVSAIIVQEPRLSKKGVQLANIQLAAPEMFAEYPVASRRTVSWKDSRILHYNETKEFLKLAKIEVAEEFGSIPFSGLLDEPPVLMWEHGGRCPCGKRSYLFGQCPKCLREDLEMKGEEHQKVEQVKDTDNSLTLEPEPYVDKWHNDGTLPNTETTGVSATLPGVLPYPPIKVGRQTQRLEFLDQFTVRRVANETQLWKGDVLTIPWSSDKVIELPKNKSLDRPYRITFVIEANTRDVIPLQQCVDIRFEESHKAGPTNWLVGMDKMIGVWEPTPVSRQLDGLLEYCEEAGTVCGRVNGPMKRFVCTVLQPSPYYLIRRRSKHKNSDWESQLWNMITHERPVESDGKPYPSEKKGFYATKAIVFGRSKELDRWIVIFARDYPCTRREFHSALQSVLHSKDATHWCVIWGRIPAGGRQVVSLFSHQWMIYDRYGQFVFDQKKTVEYSHPQSSAPCQVPAADANVGSVEGSSPNTMFKEGRGDPKTLIDGVDELVLTPDALCHYEKLYDKRKAIADDVRADSGECEFKLGQSLRVTWVSAQRSDKSLMPMFSGKELETGYRLAKDGLLERLVQLPPPANATWVPIVPDGQATGNLSWKRWLFLQCHVGILGAHRNAEKTNALLSRQVWWPSMKDNVKVWTENCLTCVRFRKIPQRQEAVPVIPTNAECWEEVMIDLEGPSNPSTKNGHKYTMTYICCLCHGVFLEGSARITANDTRRMFACCIMRSGTLPTLVRSDRGPELKNILMAEYSSMIGLGHRFGTPWRPMEQGLVESKHKETQKIMGMLVKDIMQCFPNEIGELTHVVEFVIYNTPGPHGYTPRDIDRRWSLATPLDKELQPFSVCEFEPVGDYVKTLFKNYREIRVRVLGWLKESSEKRAELANRFRRSKTLRPGDEVVVRDPRQRKAGGRTPYPPRRRSGPRRPIGLPALQTAPHGMNI